MRMPSPVRLPAVERPRHRQPAVLEPDRAQVDLAARLVARHLTLGHSPQALIATLARAVLREDAGFHAYQMLETGVRQFGLWGDTDEGGRILIALARYLAAHSPRSARRCRRPISPSA